MTMSFPSRVGLGQWVNPWCSTLNEPHPPQGMQKRLQWLVDVTTRRERGQTVHLAVATILPSRAVVHSRAPLASGRSSWGRSRLHTSTHSLWKTMWIKAPHAKLF